MIIKETRAAKNKKAVIFCCDHNVVRFAQFVADQIIQAEPEYDFDICITTFDEALFEFDKIPDDFRICQINEDDFKNLSIDQRIPSTAYIKLALPEIFADDYEQIVYLDTDIYLRTGKISDLFNEAPLGVAVAGVVDSIQWNSSPNPTREEYWEKLGISDVKYMNTGVLVYDVAKCNEIDFSQGTLKKAREVLLLQMQNPHLHFFHDQSAINAFLKGDWTSLSLKWNWQTLNSNTAHTEVFDPKILHFIAETKPWLSDPVWYTEEYFPAYHNFFISTLREPLPYATHGGFPDRNKPGLLNAIRREVSSRKLVTMINSVNPFRYTKLYSMIPRYRKLKLLKKMESAIESGEPTWPISVLFSKRK